MEQNINTRMEISSQKMTLCSTDAKNRFFCLAKGPFLGTYYFVDYWNGV